MLPRLNEEQQKVLTSMNKYWEEISKRESVDRLAANELVQMFSVIKPIDALLIVGHYGSSGMVKLPTVTLDIKPYLNHLPTCNINQNWDEALQAMADTPLKFRDEGYHIAVSEIEQKRKKCTCGFDNIIKQLEKK